MEKMCSINARQSLKLHLLLVYCCCPLYSQVFSQERTLRSLLGGRQVHRVQYRQCEDSAEEVGSGELRERFINPVKTRRT